MWKPHITVAAVIEHQQQFVLVTDNTSLGLKLNQPAGHMEPNEDLLAAVIREVKEETSLDFIPEAIVGIYLYNPNPQHTYLRICFSGQLKDYSLTPAPSPTDDGVVAAGWYDLATIKNRKDEHRSELVLRCLADYLNGHRFPLSILDSYRG